MGLLSATSIGVGAMIGAGLFALIGVAIGIAGSLAILSFLIAGIVTLLTSYSIAKLAVRYPNKAGPVIYLNRGFGGGIFSGGLNLVMWIGYLIVTALYARAFGEYSLALLGLDPGSAWIYPLSSFIVILFIVINFIGSSAVGRTELLIVGIKVTILLVFGIAGLFTGEISNFSLSGSFTTGNMLLAAGVVFMSYEGFGLIANTAEDIRNPERNLPKAIFLAVIVVILVYALVSITVIGNLSIGEIGKAKEYALAEAARPIMGSLGFTIMGIAALFSTSSAINATIYGPIRMLQETAKAGQISHFFTRRVLNHSSGMALIVTGVIILTAANLLNLESIAETGSMIFLLIYTMVNIANLKLRTKTGSHPLIIWFAIAGTTLSFAALFYFQVIRNSPSVWLLLGVCLTGFTYEWIRQRLSPGI